MEKYIVDGKVAVLVSSGCGAGWSTWGEKNLAYDRRVVEFWMSHKNDSEFMREITCFDSPIQQNAKKYFKSLGYDNVYFGGFADIRIKWMPEGTKFTIREYDGSEYIQTENDIDWMIA